MTFILRDLTKKKENKESLNEVKSFYFTNITKVQPDPFIILRSIWDFSELTFPIS